MKCESDIKARISWLKIALDNTNSKMNRARIEAGISTLKWVLVDEVENENKQ